MSIKKFKKERKSNIIARYIDIIVKFLKVDRVVQAY